METDRADGQHAAGLEQVLRPVHQAGELLVAVAVGRQVVEQAEFLKHDADAPPDQGKPGMAQAANVLPEDVEVSPRRAERQEQELEQG